jgi:hypothetical protein
MSTIKRYSWVLAVFLIASLFTGIIYWWQADWYVYVHMPDVEGGRLPKFKLEPIEQCIESTIIGLLFGGIATVIIFILTRTVARGIQRRANKHEEKHEVE